MKKFLSLVAVLGIISAVSIQSANAFSWSSLNPWSKCRCNKCEKKIQQPCPCPTGYAAPNDPCEKIKKSAPCDACDRLQEQMAPNNAK